MTFTNKRIRAGWLIDGSGSRVVKDCLIEISGERISSVAGVTPDRGPSSEYLDFSPCTIIPGLVDSHTHLTMFGTLDPETRNAQISDEYHSAESRIKRNIIDYLDYGVVAVRDGGDFHAHVLRYKNEFNSSKDVSVKIYAAGKGYHAKGRYGQLLGMYLQPGKDLALAILEDHKKGIDHIKVVNSGLNSLTEFAMETSPQFTGEQLKRAVEAAESVGLGIMVHANGKLPVQLAIEAGCHSIEHGFFMGEENLKRMSDKGVVWVPTACTMKAYMETTGPDSQGRCVAEKNLINQLGQIEKAIEYGVTTALGTDAGCPGVYHGPSIIDELDLFMKAGYSLEQAVKCATSNAMEIIDDDANAGTISEGMDATFVVVWGTPDDLPGSLKNIREVWIKGKKVRVDPGFDGAREGSRTPTPCGTGS